MPESTIMRALMDVIRERRSRDGGEKSYVASLVRGGVAKIGAKIVEEAAEVVEAGEASDEAGRTHLIKEVADLVFHSMVLLSYRDADWADVEAELERRFGTSGLVEKQSRGRSS